MDNQTSPRYVILCVDDDADVLKSLERSLRMLEGYKILTALSGGQALELLTREKVDLAIVDERMPELSGHELLKIIKEQYPHVVRIMLSGYSDFESLVKAVNEGEIFRFLSKPWDDAELKELIRRALERKKSQEKDDQGN